MTTQDFLSHKNLALVRLSAQTPVMGGKMNEELAKKGYTIPVVYLNTSPGDPSIESVGGKVEGAIISVPRSECAAAVQEAIDAGIPRLSLQSGSDSKEAIALCEANQVPVISNACVMMYAAPVESVHAFHRGLWRLIGKLQA
jgi:predicted CoA-binding protein